MPRQPVPPHRLTSPAGETHHLSAAGAPVARLAAWLAWEWFSANKRRRCASREDRNGLVRELEAAILAGFRGEDFGDSAAAEEAFEALHPHGIEESLR